LYKYVIYQAFADCSFENDVSISVITCCVFDQGTRGIGELCCDGCLCWFTLPLFAFEERRDSERYRQYITHQMCLSASSL